MKNILLAFVLTFICLSVFSQKTDTLSNKAALIGLNETIETGKTPSMLKTIFLPTIEGNLSYQWQSSVDGTTWMTISSATSKDYQPGPLTQNTFFRQIVSNSKTKLISNSVLITVKNKQ